ncbi:MAG: hypothetical protein LH472_12470 [Pyrinomonadaceae bacterium]|nr:hypothetical protein [Pyrinomonadaceae bacterium]
MKETVEEMKSRFRSRQKNLPVEEKIRQLYAMQQRYLMISEIAVKNNLKKPSAEFERALRLLKK